jgi:DNA-binding NtrC family response regulator
VTVAVGSHPEFAGAHPDSAHVDVLVVDDDEAIRSTWAAILRASGYSVEVVDDGDVALDFLERREAGLVLLDLRMPRLDGISVLEALITPQLVVLASGVSLDEATMARVKAKVVTFLEKPVPPERLLDVVSAALRPTLVADVPQPGRS